MAKLMTDEFIEELAQAVDFIITKTFNTRSTMNIIYDDENDKWWLLIFLLGTQERINADTKEKEIFYFFLAVETSDVFVRKIDSPSKLHLITLSNSEVHRRTILHRKFEL